MESNNMENSSVPHFFKKNEMKFGGEENNKTIILNNNLNNLNNNPKDTKERMQNLFPNLPQEDINNVLERAEYNIEKAIILIKEIKEQKNKLNTLKNPINQNNRKRLIKRNYNSILQQEQKRNDIHSYNINNINNNRNITTNLENNTNDNNKNIDINPGKIDIKNNNLADKNDSDINSQEKKFNPTQARESNINNNNNNNNNNNDIQKKEESELNNNNNDSMDENRKNLINAQINFLLGKFSKMNDISELKKLLKEIGFPEKKENKDEKENENNNNKLEEELKEKIEDNKEERKFIINQYKKHNAICEIIKQREDKIDELTSTLGNLIDAESEQKMREEEYKNELMEYVKSLSENNNFNFPREGY